MKSLTRSALLDATGASFGIGWYQKLVGANTRLSAHDA